MAPPLLNLQNIQLTHGGTPLLSGAELCVSARDRLCLVGRNGSGKSTLLKIAAGELDFDQGNRFLQPGRTVRYLPQEPDMSAFATTLAYVEHGMQDGDDHYRALYLLNALGLTGQEETKRLSGGEARRAALARVLAPEPDILLLDEPTNHLDLPVIEWLEQELKSLRSAIVLISHDRRFLSNLSSTTLWLDRGQTRLLNAGFSEFESWRDKILEEEELDRHKLNRQIVMEEDWVRHGVSGRRKRNQGRLARLDDLRSDRRDFQKSAGTVKLDVSEGATSGKLVVEAKNISIAFDDRPIVRAFSTRIQRGDRVGIVGPNGAGKTTLIRLLTGQLSPDSGHVKLGMSLEMATLDQKRASLEAGTTLMEALTGGGGEWIEINGSRKHVIGYMKDFLFPPEQARTPVDRLSGGERGRLTLARAFSIPSNFLILDEPTNDLDLETLDVLQEMLADYQGTVIVVSHDRDFLDRVVTSVIVAEQGGEWLEYAGGYSDMITQRGFGVQPLNRNDMAENNQNTRQQAHAQSVQSTAEILVAPTNTSKKRLSFKDKHALETMPIRMSEMRLKISQLEKILEDPQLYTRSPAQFSKASEGLKTEQLALATLEDEWLRLEILREEVES